MGYIHGMNVTPDRDSVNLAATDLNLLVSLLALLEERSVTKAAERMGLSQPAMSHALRRIRRLLGDEILVRDGNVSALTPKAASLLGPLRAILSRTTTLLGGEEFEPSTSTRTVTIAASASIVYGVGPAIASVLERQAPNMTLRMVATNDMSDAVFTEGGADVLLLAQGYDTPHERERLFDDDWVVIGGTDELSDATVVSLLSRWPHVSLDSERVPRPYQELRSRGIDVDVDVRVSDYLLIPQFVAGRERIALHRRSVMKGMAAGRELFVVDFPFPIIGLAVDLVRNPWLDDPAYWGWLRDVLIAAVHID